MSSTATDFDDDETAASVWSWLNGKEVEEGDVDDDDSVEVVSGGEGVWEWELVLDKRDILISLKQKQTYKNMCWHEMSIIEQHNSSSSIAIQQHG